MGKNDWTSNQQILRGVMNQPYWVASGHVDGTGLTTAYLAGGSIRWPSQTNIQLKDPFTFQFGPTAASSYYALFAIPSSPNVVVSGFASLASLPSAPVKLAEPIGVIETGNPNNTANLLGPWSDPTTYELRGQYSTVLAARPRAIYTQTSSINMQSYAAGGGIPASVNSVSTASGIAFLGMADSMPTDGYTIVEASVRLMASGALTGGALYITPVLSAFTSEDIGSAPFAVFPQTLAFTVAQDPDSATRGAVNVHTINFSAINFGPTQRTSSGYMLGLSFDSSAQRTDANTGVRITGVSFIARPNNRGAFRTEN